MTLFNFMQKGLADRRPSPGYSYAVAKPGSFRITFSVQPRELVLALSRIERVCGLDERAEDIARDTQFRV